MLSNVSSSDSVDVDVSDEAAPTVTVELPHRRSLDLADFFRSLSKKQADLSILSYILELVSVFVCGC